MLGVFYLLIGYNIVKTYPSFNMELTKIDYTYK